ncbi:MAG: amidohydrolase family protein [Clostridia bacterium]|nr:amidohydrolase family protein [Clostridia bacterium]
MLIDFHTHAFPDKLAERALGTLAVKVRMIPETNGSIAGLLEAMDRCGVDRSVVCNIATNARQMTNVNNFAIETLRMYGDRLTPLGSINPQAERQSEEIERLRNAGIPGLKLHPDYMGYRIDDSVYDEIFDTASELGMFIIIHAGFDVYSPGKVWAPPEAVRKRLEKSPGTTLICAHFGGNMMWTEVEEKLLGRNLYIDTSMGYLEGLSREQASRMLNKHDSDRILFGSDCPWSNPGETFRYVDSLSITDEQKEKIFYRNASELLNL